MTVPVRLERVSKSFAGVTVLREVDFEVEGGEVHALLGENGAGKSTLIKIIAGVHAPDSGSILLDGVAHRSLTPKQAVGGGIATVYQELLLFPELTVAENVFLGHAPRTRFGALDWRLMRRTARRLLDSLDSPDLDVDAKVGTLSVANRQRVEIAKALSQDAKVLIMDEPTAALADADVHRLMAVIRRLRERGVGIIYVSHKLPEIFEIADRVTVLRDGALIGTKADRRGHRAKPRRHDGRPRDRPAVPPARGHARPGDAAGHQPLARGPRPRHLLRVAARRDRRPRRPRRLRPHRARAHPFRHHPRHLRPHRGRRQSGGDRHAPSRRATSASPMSPRTAACRGWCVP